MPQPTVASATGVRGSAVKPGEIESILIRRAGNGFTADIQTKQKPLKKNENRDWNAGNELEVFNTLDGLIEGVRSAFVDVKLQK